MNYIFNEFRHQSVDFTDEKLVAEYDSKQLATIEDGRELAKELGIEAQHRVIEFGPGTGALSIAMSEICTHVYAVDTSQPMLAFIKKSAADQKVRNLSTHHAGFLSYEHENEAVDFIITKFAFHHLPDMWKAVALTRMNAMLKLGGRLYIEDVIFSFEPHRYQTVLDSWIEQVTQRSGWSRDDFEVHVNEEYSTFSWILEGMIRDAGFRLIDANYWSETYGNILVEKVSSHAQI
ncbi:MAG: class I SAM-dependent methyltransferase [Chloroflexota bacterium]